VRLARDAVLQRAGAGRAGLDGSAHADPRARGPGRALPCRARAFFGEGAGGPHPGGRRDQRLEPDRDILPCTRGILPSRGDRVVARRGADAEDIVQEAHLRWQLAAPAEVESPRTYLGDPLPRPRPRPGPKTAQSYWTAATRDSIHRASAGAGRRPLPS